MSNYLGNEYLEHNVIIITMSILCSPDISMQIVSPFRNIPKWGSVLGQQNYTFMASGGGEIAAIIKTEKFHNINTYPT